jgi:hypothetical protein
MTMREKIQNQIKITCEDIDLTELTNIEFYVRQFRFFGCYTPYVISATEMVVTIPFEDAKKLKQGKVELQFAFVDKNGVPNASDVVTETVAELLKESGYDFV